MKDSKEKEDRISDLKNMMNNVKKEDIDDSLEVEDAKDVFEIEDENEDYEIVAADEMIKELNEEDNNEEEKEKPLIIDDEFIYNPTKSDLDEEPQNLEDNSQIDEEFIIQTKLEDSKLDEDTNDESNQSYYEENGYISDQFDNVVHARVGKIPIMAVVATIVGIIFIIVAIYLTTQTSARVVDNVVSGESTTGIVIIAVLGLFLIAIGVYKIFELKNPFEDFNQSIKNIEKPKKQVDLKKRETEEIKPKTEKNIVPKSKIPLDKEAYKIGEFDMGEFKEKLDKPTSKLKGVTHKTVERSEDNITKEIPKPEKIESEKKVEKPKLSEKEIEEKEYQKARLEGESIDDIFSEIEEIEDIPIVSVDSQEKIENSSKKDE